ncbi:unnamed protein product [Brachionus calyciflorus]|uniref:Peptidase C45 hydrolase domain-containing protein n=1 Tax=Brachionus calyciflorus TaxID=104777 RepID=A0A814PD97_9BILA|nr:unnamed protein product [Brachionus calyciflorus]
MRHEFPYFKCHGTHYECGFAIGKEFEYRIKEYLKEFKEFEEYLLPAINSNDGKILLDTFLTTTNKKYPWYVEEMKGIADGSSLPFDHILALNFRVELLHVTKNKTEALIIEEEELEKLMECSDFSLNTNEKKLILHNEDCASSVYTTGYFVACEIIPQREDYPHEDFTCFCYPGHLPGNAFAFNSSGFTFSVDALVPRYIALKRFPRQIVSRAMLSAKNLRNLEDILLNTPIAFGFCLNLGYFGENMSLLETEWNSEYFTPHENINSKNNIKPIMWNYELAPNLESNKTSKVSKHCIVSSSEDNLSDFYSLDYCYHFNHYERVIIDQCVVHSSRHRRKRADEMKRPENLQDLLNIAFDDKDEKYPIYRIKESYSVQCAATVLFDLKEKRMSIYDGRIAKEHPIFDLPMNLKFINH